MKKEKQKFRGISRILFLFLAAMVLSLSGFAQNVVSGTVSSADGELIPGATIVLKGTSTGTVSDMDGKFSLNVKEGDVLSISFVGMKSQEITVSGQSQIAVSLEVDVIGLEEVVAIGYGTAKKSDLTGATVSADIEAFRESPNVNIMQSLQGSVPGVQIGQVNQAGEEPNIEIRGQSTLSGNKSPLIVVDEIIYRGRIADINPADIQSVDILKDASSKAIYGAQAANGVIIITTKTGKKTRKPTFTYSGSISSQNPTVDARPLNREEVLQKTKDVMYRDAYLSPDYVTPNPDWDYSQSELLPLLLTGIENNTNYDWWDATTSPGNIMNHVLSVSGGSENTTYYMSGGYTEQEGFVLNDNYSRTTLRINLQTEITDWLTLGTNAFGSFTNFSGTFPNMGTLIRGTSPLVKPKDDNGNYIINTLGDNNVNPLLNALADNRELKNRVSANFFAIVKIPQIQGLTYRLNYNNNLGWHTTAASNKYSAGQTGAANKNYANNTEMLLDNILTYEKQFGNNHDLKATVVAGMTEVNYDWTSARAENIPNLSLSYNSLEQGIIQTVGSNAWKETSMYQMARVNYDFKNKYLITATLRRDGFSGFAKNNKVALFSSVGAGWVITEEDFFEVPKIDYLKLRASYGQNGNQTSRYSSLATISASEGSKYVYGDGVSTAPGQSIASLANNDLTWELTTGLNLGLDFGIFDNKIRGNIEYYNSKTTNLLWNQKLPEMTGFSEIKTNLGELTNSGFEFLIQTTPVKSSDFSWDMDISFSRNVNEVVSLLGEDLDGDGVEDDLISSNLFIGHPIGTIYGYEIEDMWQVNDDLAPGYYPGTYKIKDQQASEGGEYKITAADDRVILGSSQPAYRFGIQNTLKYKDFTLRFFINSIQGGKDGYLGANHPYGIGATSGTAQNSNWFNFYDYWSPSNPDAKYPNPWVLSAIQPPQYYQRNFVRLQDISFAYDLNNKLAKSIGVQGIKLYVSGKNLLTLTKWDGWDPETNQGIAINDAFPLMKSYTFGVDVTF